jgi:exopolyphosphatase / guanosine-5'-triphosphate,3'-diphosphate pyrophosphatase
VAPNADVGTESSTEPEVVPRWEWRTFGDSFGNAGDLLDHLVPVDVKQSDDLYFLSTRSGASVKVRDGLMDVKHLLRVNDDGLELWMPVMKTGFPLSVDEVLAVLTTLDVAVAALSRTSYTLEAFENDVVRPNPELLAVRVLKRRRSYVVDECMVETAEFRTDRSTTHTLALESPDASLVSAMLRQLQLNGRSNVSVARGLKGLVRFGRYAVIDVGTNSVKFHLGERQADGGLVTVVDRAQITRLGQGQAESGMLAADAIQRTAEVVAAMADEARGNGAVDIAAVGTAGLRRAPNRAALVEAVRDRCGIDVEVISGEDEARLAYVAATLALPSARGALVVFDSGGGSTQFTFGQGERVDEQFSIDVGAVRVTERFGLAHAVSEDALHAALAGIAVELGGLDGRPEPDAILAIGGTATNLAAVKHGLERYDPDVVHGTVLDLAEVDRQIELYRGRDADERRQIVGLQPERAEVILAGACIVKTIFTKLHHDSLRVSDRGLRHGVFIDRFAR